MQCEQCGAEVNMKQLIKVSYEEEGEQVTTGMPFDEFLDLLDDLGIPKPPIVCERHPEMADVVTTAC